MPKKKKGKSHSIRPVSKRPPSWCKYQPEEVEALVIKLAKEGQPPSRIGTILRDQHAIPLVKLITGKTITQIVKEAELAPTTPEDLGNLLKKAATSKKTRKTYTTREPSNLPKQKSTNSQDTTNGKESYLQTGSTNQKYPS